jgi:hypothetical protein
MADYHPLIASAVAKLESNTPEARAALYERVRSAFLTHSAGMSELDVGRERLALEIAIRDIEGAAIRVRSMPPPVPPPLVPTPPAPASPPKPSLSSPLHRPTTVFLVISIFFPNWWLIDVTCMSLYWVARLPLR